MRKWAKDFNWKYFWIEAIFFITLYYLFPIITDVEYAYNEQHNASLFSEGIVERLVYGTSSLVHGIIFYLIVKRALVHKKIILFLIYTIVFLIGLHYYTKLVYIIVAHAGWLPLTMQESAGRWAQANVLTHFSIIFMMREFLCIATLGYFINWDKQNKELQALKEQQLYTELNYLKAQLHPHFFFNTINNIYSLALKQSIDTAPMVAKLGDMMRYILYETSGERVLLMKEVDFLKNYIDVERIRHQHNIINFDVQGIMEGNYIEPLLLLPFIENAFKHGLEHEIGQGFANIVLVLTHNELTLEVSNSKPGIPEKPAGIGLQNVLKRLNILYPNRYNLDVKDEADIYRASLTLQLS